LHTFTAVRQHSLLVLRWSEAIPLNPEIALLSPYPLADVVAIIRTLAEHDAVRPRLVSQKLAAAVNARPNPAGASAGTLEAARFEAGELSFHGWARVPDQDRPADCVVLGFEANGEWSFCVLKREEPADAPAGKRALKHAGFSGGSGQPTSRGEIILKARRRSPERATSDRRRGERPEPITSGSAWGSYR
jgi:hypothetical protein